jgi:primosomal protein N' (replication factor Y)
MSKLFAEIVLDGATDAYDKRYTYLIPDTLKGIAKEGCRVTVPFGRANIKKQGMILALFENADVKNCKEICSVTDEKPVLNEEMLKLCEWMHEQNFCTYFDAINTMLPTGLKFKLKQFYTLNPDYNAQDDQNKEIIDYLLKTGEVKAEKLEDIFDFDLISELKEKGVILKSSEAVRRLNDLTSRWLKISENADLNAIKLTERQREIYNLVEEIGSVSVKEVKYFTGVTDSVISALKQKGVLEEFEKEEFRIPYKNATASKREVINLTPHQNKAYEGLKELMQSAKAQTVLLYGVTGSGKTMAFLKAVDDVVDEGKGVIIMVPEIALTPQIIKLFSTRYGSKIAVFHSAMSLGQRMDEYKRIKQGKALIAIGTRSAVFAPFDNLGLIIIDEEQEHTYKSEMSPRFHARDVAKFRAAYHKCVLCLASATPSMESYSQALSGKYTLLTLSERYGNAKLPDVTVVDMRKEIANGNSSSISSVLAEAIETELQSKKQVVLLLNRRGHNTYISCPKCGWVASCDNCSISLTYHSANKRLMCHYCGHSESIPQKCPECESEHIVFLGAGTQKLEEELNMLFPDAKVLRLDADSTMTKDSFATKLTDFSEGKYDILLGTQMVAKGLDFPKVSLVGVIGADRALYTDDYRGFERSFSIITQVVGRAGRAGGESRAIIQTTDPENSVISLAKAQDYDAFYKEEILTRKLMTYPPFCDICMVAATSADSALANDAINQVFENIRTAISGEYADVKLIIMGPSLASVSKVNNRYRYKMVIKCKNNKRFRELLRKALTINQKGDLSVFVDINPENIL